jgi:phosphoglycolate phosphatase-like HAD superfamily hydrolase
LLRHIKLLVFDLDYIVFDCSALKVAALRQSLISFADAIPQSVRLPDLQDAEEGFRQHGFRWTQFLEIGLDEERLAEVAQAYRINEERLIAARIGQIYPGILEFLSGCRHRQVALALGAEASREYLLSVSDRHELDSFFEAALCTEEYGVGSSEEMLEDLMRQAEVFPSETLVLGTRPAFFDAAHNLDVLTVGCGWGIHKFDGLREADLQALTIGRLLPAIREADELAAQYLK